MKNVKIVVVDDSPFSVAMLTNMLNSSGFNVVGSASNMEEAVDAVVRLKPDVVTMDMTMPGTNGIECTKAIHQIDSNIKVVIVSSMMDEEIVRNAHKVNIAGYIQKPVDAGELTLIINRIMADEELFIELKGLYYTVFKEALSDTFNKFFKAVPDFQQEDNSNTEQVSRGISTVIGIIGKYGGRMILDMSYETGKKITDALFNKDTQNKQEIINTLAEMSNIVAGNACSMLNRTNKLLGLRVAPPTVVYGESLNISKSELDCLASTKTESAFGEIYMSIGFKRGEWNG
jgi:DNA-binding NarL/FixJ family response regulator